jgi:hypothetical protein
LKKITLLILGLFRNCRGEASTGNPNDPILDLEPIRKWKGVEKKDVSGLEYGFSKPKLAEIRHEKG